jgi:hypothetical protein
MRSEIFKFEDPKENRVCCDNDATLEILLDILEEASIRGVTIDIPPFGLAFTQIFQNPNPDKIWQMKKRYYTIDCALDSDNLTFSFANLRRFCGSHQEDVTIQFGDPNSLDDIIKVFKGIDYCWR